MSISMLEDTYNIKSKYWIISRLTQLKKKKKRKNQTVEAKKKKNAKESSNVDQPVLFLIRSFSFSFDTTSGLLFFFGAAKIVHS